MAKAKRVTSWLSSYVRFRPSKDVNELSGSGEEFEGGSLPAWAVVDDVCGDSLLNEDNSSAPRWSHSVSSGYVRPPELHDANANEVMVTDCVGQIIGGYVMALPRNQGMFDHPHTLGVPHPEDDETGTETGREFDDDVEEESWLTGHKEVGTLCSTATFLEEALQSQMPNQSMMGGDSTATEVSETLAAAFEAFGGENLASMSVTGTPMIVENPDQHGYGRKLNGSSDSLQCNSKRVNLSAGVYTSESCVKKAMAETGSGGVVVVETKSPTLQSQSNASDSSPGNTTEPRGSFTDTQSAGGTITPTPHHKVKTGSGGALSGIWRTISNQGKKAIPSPHSRDVTPDHSFHSQKFVQSDIHPDGVHSGASSGVKSYHESEVGHDFNDHRKCESLGSFPLAETIESGIAPNTNSNRVAFVQGESSPSGCNSAMSSEGTKYMPQSSSSNFTPGPRKTASNAHSFDLSSSSGNGVPSPYVPRPTQTSRGERFLRRLRFGETNDCDVFEEWISTLLDGCTNVAETVYDAYYGYSDPHSNDAPKPKERPSVPQVVDTPGGPYIRFIHPDLQQLALRQGLISEAELPPVTTC